jgi:hypothetical protein
VAHLSERGLGCLRVLGVDYRRFAQLEGAEDEVKGIHERRSRNVDVLWNVPARNEGRR